MIPFLHTLTVACFLLLQVPPPQQDNNTKVEKRKIKYVDLTPPVNLNDKKIVTGTIISADNKEPLPAVAIVSPHRDLNTYSDDKGRFVLATKMSDSIFFPLEIQVTSVGYYPYSIYLKKMGEVLKIELKPKEEIGEDIVISASRTKEKLLNSGVSLERLTSANIAAIATPNYYQALSNLKGVDITTSSLNFSTLSTHGFNGSPQRFNQFIDGMDNQAPGLNFSAGNILGITQLDIDNLELLQGASSALYGTGGINGTLLISSKNPFQYQGFSFQVKQGINNINNQAYNNLVNRTNAPSSYQDWEFRWGKKINRFFALKIAAEYVKGTDWQATDTRDLSRSLIYSTLKPGGTRANDPSYDGVNVYGDEATVNLSAFSQRALLNFSAVPGGIVATNLLQSYLSSNNPKDFNSINSWVRSNPLFGSFAQRNAIANALPVILPAFTSLSNPYRNLYGNAAVSRTGYAEADLVDYNNYTLKLNGGLYFKFTPTIEGSFEAFLGSGSSVLTVSDRYALRDFKAGQFKLEVKAKKWFARIYTTQENSGNTYTATATALSINNAWKPDAQWFEDYTTRYFFAATGQVTGKPITDNIALDQYARSGILNGVYTGAYNGVNPADNGRYLPGSQEYLDAFNNAKNQPFKQGGSKFYDRSALYHGDVQYNILKDLLVGGSLRVYDLNSKGTIFTDSLTRIKTMEAGLFVKFDRDFFRKVLKLSIALRYDKKTSFDSRLTPRFTAVYNPNKIHFIRFSVQSGYRYPANTDQFLNFPIPNGYLLGATASLNSYYQFDKFPAYTAQSIVNYRNSVDPLTNQGDQSLLVQTELPTVKPESVIAFELGYRTTFLRKIYIDAYTYYSTYYNFIGASSIGRAVDYKVPYLAPQELLNPYYTTNFLYSANSSTPINTWGWGASLEYKFLRAYQMKFNISGDNILGVPAGFITYFNAPKVRLNYSITNPQVWRNIGFNLTYRWQGQLYWESVFGSGEVSQYGYLDGYVSYRFTKLNSSLRLGGSNLTNTYYLPAFGNPKIGAIYYVSLAYNVL
ncbi:MAG: TonB-dependent receptor [Phycisphaerales bacterium]|nr:TonB-dependent receptor [Phycisphaerales bacterium]